MMDRTALAQVIDHSLLRPDATIAAIEQLCSEARYFGFHAVCLSPAMISAARGMLTGSAVKIATVIGFPHGATLTQVKVYEAIESLLCGSDELDIVMNIGWAKSGRWKELSRDISQVIAATEGAFRKIIIETSCLDREEILKASDIALAAGADFIKTSTGYGSRGATEEDIRLIKSVVKNGCGIKASGGIRTLFQVRELLAAGATRIGTSAGVSLMREAG